MCCANRKDMANSGYQINNPTNLPFYDMTGYAGSLFLPIKSICQATNLAVLLVHKRLLKYIRLTIDDNFAWFKFLGRKGD